MWKRNIYTNPNINPCAKLMRFTVNVAKYCFCRLFHSNDFCDIVNGCGILFNVIFLLTKLFTRSIARTQSIDHFNHFNKVNLTETGIHVSNGTNKLLIYGEKFF